jgi:hypothetical protein
MKLIHLTWFITRAGQISFFFKKCHLKDPVEKYYGSLGSMSIPV